MVCHVELGSASTGLEQFSAVAAQGSSKLIAPRPTVPITVDNRMRMKAPLCPWLKNTAGSIARKAPQRSYSQKKIPVLFTAAALHVSGFSVESRSSSCHPDLSGGTCGCCPATISPIVLASLVSWRLFFR